MPADAGREPPAGPDRGGRAARRGLSARAGLSRRGGLGRDRLPAASSCASSWDGSRRGWTPPHWSSSGLDFTRASRTVDGLESLIIGARPEADGVDAAIVSVWRDVDAMTRATAVDEDVRFIGMRLDLPFEIERTDHYEIVGRTFAALPPAASALVRHPDRHVRPERRSPPG